ncbi:MAG: glycosyl hydrolase 53 family protein [Bacteroidia bacterium]|nr:glycosyl hydrolase 53 family protein [Bacteroidia bacterium]
MKIHTKFFVAFMGVILPAICFSNQKLNDVEPNAGVELVITPYSTTIFADGHTKSAIVVRVLDKSGDDVTNTEAPLKILVKGNGSIVVNETSGNRQSVIKKIQEGIWEAQLINGSCSFSLIAGSTPDKLKVEVSSEGLKSASTEIHSIMPFKLLSPKKEQLKPSGKTIGKMLGADISFLPQLESRGIKFSDNGVQKDAIEILKDHGFNYIRLRIFNNPAAAKGYSPQKGFCDLEHTKQMALRIKKAGMKLLLDFHYSDYWADPQQQNKPSAWDGLENEKLASALKDYTKEVISALKNQGTSPDMVQIGNEINHGMVWPDGHIGNPDQLARLIKAGAEGVNEVDPSIIIMLHIALGGQNDESVFWLDNMIARGVKFDIIGLSYYPRWHGTLTDLKNNMLDLISRYKKDINLVEYSQKKEEVNDIVFNLPNGRGKGTCIWEPLSTWEQIFDRDGKSNDLIKTYDKIARKYLIEK